MAVDWSPVATNQVMPEATRKLEKARNIPSVPSEEYGPVDTYDLRLLASRALRAYISYFKPSSVW